MHLQYPNVVLPFWLWGTWLAITCFLIIISAITAGQASAYKKLYAEALRLIDNDIKRIREENAHWIKKIREARESRTTIPEKNE